MSTETSIGACVAELDRLLKVLEAAREKESEARSEVNRAVNHVNACQKDLDARIAALKASAPWNTDWHRQRNPGVPV